MDDGSNFAAPAAGILVTILLVLTLVAPGATMPGGGETTDIFGDGEKTSLITFGSGGGEDNGTKLLLPAGTNVSGATFTVSTVHSAAGDYPSVVKVDVGGDGDMEWKFGSSGFGRFGLQERLWNSAASESVIITDGSNDTLYIRLPKTATVTNATINMTGHWNGIRNGDFEDGTNGWTELDYWNRAAMTTRSTRGGNYPGPTWGGNGNYLHIYSTSFAQNQNACYVEVVSDPYKYQWGDYITMSWDMVEIDRYYCGIYSGDIDGNWAYMDHIGATNANQDNDIDHLENVTGVTYDVSGINGDDDRYLEFTLYSAWDNDGDWGRIAADDIYLSYSDGTPIPVWPNNTGLDVGSDGTSEWSMTGLLDTPRLVGGLESTFNDLLDTLPVSGKDSYGNAYVDIPLNLTSTDIAEVGVADIHIEYDYTATVKKKPGVGNLSTEITDHVTALSRSDSRADVEIPVKVFSDTAGQVELGDLLLIYNGAPMFSDIPDLETDEDTSVPSLLDLSAYVADDDDAFVDLTFDIIKVSDFGKVRLTLADGVVGVNLGKAGDYNTDPGGPLVFRILAADTMGLERESPDISLYIHPVNDEPEVFMDMPVLEVEEDTSQVKLDLVLGEYFRDPDGDAMAYAAAVDPEGEVEDENLTASVTASGVLKLTPGADYYGSMVPVYVFADDGDVGDAPGALTVNATVTGGSAYQILYVNVTPVNDPPVWLPVEDLSLEDGGSADDHIIMAAALTDVDTPADSLVFPDPVSSDPSRVLAVLDDGLGLDITAADGTKGTAAVTLQVVDGEHLVSTSFDVTVFLQNTAPVVVDPPATVYVDEDTSAPDALNLLTSFYDQDGDVLEYTITSQGEGVNHTYDEDSGLVSFLPGPNWNGEVEFRFRAEDPGGLNASFDTTVVVVGVNDPPSAPVITAPADGVVVGGQPVLFQGGDSTDADGDELVYTWDFDVDDGEDGTVTGTGANHTFTSDGIYTVKLTVSDGTAGKSTSISVSVVGVSQGPQGGGDGGTGTAEKSSDSETASLLTLILLVIIIVLVVVFLIAYLRKRKTDKTIEEARSRATLSAARPMAGPAMTMGGLDGATALPGSPEAGGPVMDPSLLLPTQDDGGAPDGAGPSSGTPGTAGPAGSAPITIDAEVSMGPEPSTPEPAGDSVQDGQETGAASGDDVRDITGMSDEESADLSGEDAPGAGAGAKKVSRPGPRSKAGGVGGMRSKPPTQVKKPKGGDGGEGDKDVRKKEDKDGEGGGLGTLPE